MEIVLPGVRLPSGDRGVCGDGRRLSAYPLISHTAPPGHATPYHLNHDEDEAFYVLDGEFTFICDGKKTVLGPGGYIFLPRKTPHGIRCSGAVSSTILVLAMPGTGFVGVMLEMAEPAKERVLPAPAPPDLENLQRLCAKLQDRYSWPTAGVSRHSEFIPVV